MSERKALSNKQNARRSTGPRTADGKKKASRNALRHGLSVHVRADPALSAEVERLVRIFCGDNADEARCADARVIAEAQVDILRIRTARLPLIEKLLGTIDLVLDRDEGGSAEARTIVAKNDFAKSMKARPDFFAIRRQLERLDDYERRALSRQMKALHNSNR